MTKIHWANLVSASFNTAADWTGGVTPGTADDAYLDASGAAAYTVTASVSETVNGVDTNSNAILAITSAFTAINGTDGDVNAGRIAIGNGGAFAAGGTLNNVGLTTLAASSLRTSLVVASALTLTGGGEVFMGENANDIIVGSSQSAVLTNVGNTIAGGGDLGGGELTLVNGAGGKIEAEGSGAPLIIDTGANTIVNAGLIEAAGVGATIMSPVNNTGFLKADGGNLTVGGAVTGAGGAIVAGGALRFNAGFNQNVAFTGAGGGALALAQSQAYAATISGFSTTGSESLDLGDIAFVAADTPVFSGTTSGGVLTVTDGTHTAHIHLAGNYTTSAFIAGSDGHGGTSITDGPKALHWLSPVSGSFQTAADWTDGLVPGPGNDAILDAQGSTNYTVTASANQMVDTIQTAASATLDIGAGVFAATGGTGAGVNAGTIFVVDGATFSAGGLLDNAGVLDLQGTSEGADLKIGAAGLTLTGGGEVVLADSLSAPFQPCPPKYSLDRVSGGAGETLTNVDNTIVGAGWLGLGEIALVNGAKGVIDASLATDLIVDTVGTLANSGVIESTGTGGLYIIYSTVDNAAGGLIAADGGIVYLSFSDIIGGTLTSSGTGFFYLDHGSTILDGSTAGAVTNNAYVSVKDGATLTIDGAINNTDEIEIATGSVPTSLFVGTGGATLTGGGKVVLGGMSPDTRITGATADATLTNVDNTISGQGQIGAGSLILINEAGGVIDANHPAMITLDTGANTVTNAGVIETTGAGLLTLAGAVDNTGTLSVGGGTMTVNGAVTGAGVATINHGTLDVTSSFTENVTFGGTTGVLELARSQSYTGTITGFSKSGKTSLDLADIGFVGSTEATFAGTKIGGFLTVTDGSHTARINLTGDYLRSIFIASSDGRGGVTIVDPTTTGASPSSSAGFASSPHRFIAAMAGLGGAAVAAAHIGEPCSLHEPVLMKPRAMNA